MLILMLLVILHTCET